jgi:hypothetical protein
MVGLRVHFGRPSRVAGRHDCRRLDHQDDSLFWRAGPMDDPFGNDKALLWRQRHRAAFQVDDKLATEDEEKLVIVVVFMPMILSLHDAETHNRVVLLAKSLIVPLICTSLHKGGQVDE